MTEQQVQENPVSENTSEPKTATPDARYTDKDVDKLKGGARKEGRNTGRTEREQEILEATGAQSVDEVLEAYKAWQTVQEDTQTEADKARAQAEKLAKERDEAKQREAEALALADKRFVLSELKGALRDASINKDRIPLALKVADTSSVEVAENEVKGLSDVVEAIKNESPEWFGSTAQDIPRDTPAGDPAELTAEKRQENEELARRQLHRTF